MTENELHRTQEMDLREQRRSIAVANQNSTVARIINIVYYLFGAVELLLALRVVLHLVGANPENGFANFIYQLSAPFVALFANLLRNPVISNTAVLEVTTIIAMIAYAVGAALVTRLVWLLLSRPR